MSNLTSPEQRAMAGVKEVLEREGITLTNFNIQYFCGGHAIAEIYGRSPKHPAQAKIENAAPALSHLRALLKHAQPQDWQRAEQLAYEISENLRDDE